MYVKFNESNKSWLYWFYDLYNAMCVEVLQAFSFKYVVYTLHIFLYMCISSQELAKKREHFK